MTNGYYNQMYYFDSSYLAGEDMAVFEFDCIPDSDRVWNMFAHIGGGEDIWLP